MIKGVFFTVKLWKIQRGMLLDTNLMSSRRRSGKIHFRVRSSA